MLTKRVHWRDNDVQLLLRIWSRHIAELRLNKRNKHVYAEMEAQMQLKNLKFSAEEIRTKIKNLTKRFRAEQKLAGCPSARWQFYEPIQSVLSQFPTLNRQHFRFNAGNGGVVVGSGGVSGGIDMGVTEHYGNYVPKQQNVIGDDEEDDDDDDDVDEDEDLDLYDENNGLPLDVDIISDPEDDDLSHTSNQFNKPSVSSTILNSNRPLISNDNNLVNTNASLMYTTRNHGQQNRYSFLNDGISVIPLEMNRNKPPMGTKTSTITNDIAKNTSPTIINHTRTTVAGAITPSAINTAATSINNNNNNNAKKIPQKRKLSAVHEEILAEMRRANRLAEENQRETNRLLQQTNDIAERNLIIYRDFFEFIKNKI